MPALTRTRFLGAWLSLSGQRFGLRQVLPIKGQTRPIAGRSGHKIFTADYTVNPLCFAVVAFRGHSIP